MWSRKTRGALGIGAGSLALAAIVLSISPDEQTKVRDSRQAPAAAMHSDSWASLPPRASATREIRIDQSQSHTAGLRARFSRLGSLEPYLALDSALRLHGRDRDIALQALASSWKTDPRPELKRLSQIVKGIAALRHGGEPGVNLVALLDANPEFALLTARLANRLLTGDKRPSILGVAASAYTRIDPSVAFSLGTSLTGAELEGFVETFSKAWSAHDPEAATRWAGAIEAPAVRDRAFGVAMKAFAEKNPAQAAAWLGQVAAPAVREAAIRTLGGTWAGQNTAAALQWASSLPDSAEQNLALRTIQSIAPVGVGMALSQRQDNPYPVAMEIVPASPAAEAGAVQRFDQIVAVAGQGDQWVDTKNLPLDRVIAMIRGTAGQPVQLRVLPQGATDLSQARTVTIVRRQILLNREAGSGG